MATSKKVSKTDVVSVVTWDRIGKRAVRIGLGGDAKMTSGLIAALVGPQMFIVAKDALAPIPLAGAYAALAVLSVFGLVPLALTRLPAPTIGAPQSLKDRFASLSILKRKPVRLEVGLGAVSQGIMVFLMVPTPLAMIGCGFGEAVAGDVIRWHVVAMFAPSFFTGFLIKRYGVHPIALIGLALLIVSSIAARNGLTSVHFYGSLVLLGIGWNFGFIGATTVLANSVSEEEKALVQSANDTMIALVSTLCAFAAGAIIAWVAYGRFCDVHKRNSGNRVASSRRQNQTLAADAASGEVGSFRPLAAICTKVRFL